MNIDERLKDSAPRFREAVERFALPEPLPVSPQQVRWRSAVGVGFAMVTLIAVVVLALRPSPIGHKPSTTTPAPQEYSVDAMVVQRPGSPPQLCLGWLTSNPPQCSGAAIRGWDWSTAPGVQTAVGVTWGQYRVVGTYNDTQFTFTVTKPPAELLRPAPVGSSHKFDAPCPTPPGGWTSSDPSKVTLADYQAMTGAVPALAGYAGMWVDSQAPVDGRGVVPLYNQVITFAFTGHLAERRTEIEGMWGGAICVVQRQRSRAQLDAIVQAVQGPLARELGLRVVNGATVDDVANTVTLDVMLAPTAAQRELDQRFGVGVVRLHPVLTPLKDRAIGTQPIVTTTGPSLPAQTHVAPTKTQIRAVFTTALKCISDAGVVITLSHLTITANDVRVSLALDNVKSDKTPDEVSAIDSRCRGDLINISDAWHAAADRAARP